jgi:hypothetical protein
MADLDTGSLKRVAISKPLSPAPELLLIFACAEIAILAAAFLIMAWVHGSSLLWPVICTLMCALMPLIWLLHRQRIRNLHDWDRVTFLELRDGRIALVPSRRMRQVGYTAAEAPFPSGSSLEYQVKTGDSLFTGDHGALVQWSLWAVEPNGAKWQLRDFVDELRVGVAAANLEKAGIGFRVIKIYDGQEGEHVEADVTAERIQASSKTPKRMLVTILAGTSSLWLGVLAAAFVHDVGYVAAIGAAGFTATVVLALRSKTSRRSSLVQVATAIPSYAAGFALSVVAVWYIFKK